MSETRTLVKCALGFILAILVVAGGIFGLDIKVDITDADTPALEEDIVSTNEATVETTEIVDKTENSPAESTPTEDNQPSVDESVKVEVTQPTDNTEDVVTEGEN